MLKRNLLLCSCSYTCWQYWSYHLILLYLFSSFII